ncbi:MAG: hypothetical protein LKE31_03985 [Bacilli bacterium]|jgi:hypothetical protein|nr:hypothetical protein [Bacilli bacterium]
MNERKTVYEKSRFIIAKTGYEKVRGLRSAIDELRKEDPELKFIIVDTKRVEFLEMEQVIPMLEKRIKDVSEVASLIQKLIDENESRMDRHIDTPTICLLIAEYGDVHEQRIECDTLIKKMSLEAYQGIRLLLASQRGDELTDFMKCLRKE